MVEQHRVVFHEALAEKMIMGLVPERLRATLRPVRTSPRCGWGRAPERPGRLLSEQDGKIADPVDIIVRDHVAAVGALREAITS